MKTIKVSAVVSEMLQELSKRRKVKPDAIVEMVIEEEYRKVKWSNFLLNCIQGNPSTH